MSHYKMECDQYRHCAVDKVHGKCSDHTEFCNDWKLKHSTDNAMHPELSHKVVKEQKGHSNGNKGNNVVWIVLAIIIGVVILGVMAYLLKKKPEPYLSSSSIERI